MQYIFVIFAIIILCYGCYVMYVHAQLYTQYTFFSLIFYLLFWFFFLFFFLSFPAATQLSCVFMWTNLRRALCPHIYFSWEINIMVFAFWVEEEEEKQSSWEYFIGI